MLVYYHQNQSRTKRPNKLIVIIILAILIVLAISIPVLASSESMDVLEKTSSNMQQIEEWWDLLWDSTFNPPPLTVTTGSIGGTTTELSDSQNLSLYAFVNPTRFILGIGLIFWLFSFGSSIYESKTIAQSINVFFKVFLPVFLAIIFLFNQGKYSRELAFGMRGLINTWTSGVMSLQITDVTVREAIQNQIVAEDAKTTIIKKMNACYSINPPEVTIPSAVRPDPSSVTLTNQQRKVYDYLECLEEVRAFAKSELERGENDQECGGKVCEVFKDIYLFLFNIARTSHEQEIKKRATEEVLLDPITQAELERIESDKLSLEDEQRADLLAEEFSMSIEEFFGTVKNPSKQLFFFTQWMWMSTLEMALFLLALFAPIFIALSIIPSKQSMFNFWLIEYLTIGLAKLAYVIVVGIVAVQIAANDGSFLDNTFFWALGVFAPAVSFAVVTAGGIAAAASFKSQSVGIASATVAAASGGFAIAASSIARSIDKRR